jgi:hypothetical protein
MTRRIALGAAVLALGLGVSAPARADLTLYNQATDYNGALASQNAVGSFGNFATTYDNFTLGTASTIDSVTWVGSFFMGSPSAISGFTVQIEADNHGQPGTVLASTAVSGNAGQTFLRTDNVGDPTYSYSLSLATPFGVTAGTQYWLSIVPTIGFPPQWGWEASSGGDGIAYQNFFGTLFKVNADLAFSLVGHSNAVAAPEPSTLVAGMLGALGLVGYSRFRRLAAA